MRKGNPIGKLQYVPPPLGTVDGGSANPPVKNDWWAEWGEMVHSGLDIIGAIPVVGILADGVNAVIYTAEGEYGQAALSATSAVVNFVPGAGGVFKAGKIAAPINKALGKTSAVKAVEKSALQAEKTAVKAESRAAGKSASHTLSAKKAGSEKGGSHQSRNSRKSEPCKIPAEPLSPLTNNRLRQYADKRYEDDDFGNLTTKHSGHNDTQRLHWNAEHQQEEVVSIHNGKTQRSRYGYDGFGRRTWKQDTSGVTVFIWDGDQLLNEISDQRSHLWIYEDEHGFVSLVQATHRAGEDNKEARIYWYHNDASGLPRELTDAQGNIV
ncbi:RHS domain-containing protein [Enterobacteriaceae bacterium ESL0689]|nr:RHS domain-containing protein [Enterobacteriaceae bacterium ESL0689]